MDLNERFHARMLAIARSPLLERALEGILSLPFGGVNAMVLTEAELPESRQILVIAHRHHQGLIEAIEGRQGARAESLAREHARIALTNLEIVLRHREMLELVPGSSLITLPQELEHASR
jgi:GntR family transcriptional regulator of vanillate catabolism